MGMLIKSLKKDGGSKMRIALVLVIVIALLAGCLGAGSVEKQAATYVGSQRCGECHKNLYKEWTNTRHPYMLQEASEDTVIGDFTYNNELVVGDYATKMSASDGKYYVTTLGQDGKESTYEIKYTIGGFWKQRYLTELPYGGLHFLPVQWNVETREWVDYHGLKKYAPGDTNYWSDRNRMWQVKCAGCHVTGFQMEYDAASDKVTSSWVEGGAGCEACHGPGSIHASMSTALAARAEKIFNPGKSNSYRIGVMACGQCHIRGSSKAQAVEIPGGPGNFGYPSQPAGYYPGMNLDMFYDYKPGLWPDGTSVKHHQQYDDYIKSAHADAGVVCWDCHNAHSKGESNQYETRLPGDRLCLDCHPVTKSASLSHSIHDFGSCIGCHMPKVAKSAVAYDIASHTSDVIEPSVTIEQGGLEKQANSCNACKYHEDDEPEDLNAVMESLKKKAEG
jgi:predicted CXXCH cytochrome family protein